MLTLPEVLTLREATATRNALVATLAQAQAQAPTALAVVVDAAALKRFDSAALSVLLDLRREALAGGRGFGVSGAPAGLQDLARLYGIEPLLPAAAPAPAA